MSYPTIDQPTTDLDEQGMLYQRGDALLAAGHGAGAGPSLWSDDRQYLHEGSVTTAGRFPVPGRERGRLCRISPRLDAFVR